MPLGWVAGAMAVGAAANVYSSSVQADAAKSAANTQANAALTQQGNLLAAGQQASKQFDPYSTQGTTALSNLASNNAYFNNQDLNANLAPNYAFQLQQGQQGQNAANNATGGIVGGNAQKALQDYTQNYAGTAYQNAFNNYQTQRTNVLNNANQLAGIGQNAVQGSANAQLGIGTNISNITQGIANAQAAGTIGSANAISGGLQNAGNLYALSNLIGNNKTNGVINNPYTGTVNGPDYSQPVGNLISTND